MPQTKKLFEPIAIGRVTLPNRIAMLGMTMGLAEDYQVTPRLIDFLVARARGGAGLIILGATFPADLSGTRPRCRETPLGTGIWDDRFIPGLRRLTEALHRNGARAACQVTLHYEWRARRYMPLEVVGPSDGPDIMAAGKVRAMTTTEIHRVVSQFAEGVRRAREAGFDLVEFNAGMGYFLNRFLSPLSNRRSDDYGGTPENRMRLLLEIIDRSRQLAGSDYPLLLRLSGDEFMEGGNTLGDVKQMLPRLEQHGVAAISLQAGWHESRRPLIQRWVPAGAYVYMAQEIKRATSLPVMTAVRIDDPVMAEEIIASGKADLVGLARALLADAEFPNKAREGRLDEIRRCIVCCRCFEDIVKGMPPGCSVNAGLDMEEIRPARQSKRVLVVGGGPAGMEAAAVAARRGHRVDLWERGDRLGGQLLLAAVPPYKADINKLTQYLIKQLEKTGVRWRLKQEATAESVLEGRPDVVLLASGARPCRIKVPGVEGENVVSALDVLADAGKAGGRVAVIGGGMVGCETAEFLAEKGHKVTVVEMLAQIAGDCERVNRWFFLSRLKKAGVGIETSAKVTGITDKGVQFNREGAPGFLEADTVVLAVGMIANSGLAEQLKGKLAALYSIGDCAGPRKIAEAIKEGFRTALLV